MQLKLVALAAVLLSSTAGTARSEPEIEPTAEELACQFEECVRDSTAGGPSNEEPASDGVSAPRPRLSENRSFKLSDRVGLSAPTRDKGRVDLRLSFLTGSAELTAIGRRRATIFSEAVQLPLLAGKRFSIEGHTDAVGSRAYNRELSQQRAQALVDFLVRNGADRSRFVVIGHGFDRPLEGLARTAPDNRRVEAVRVR